MRIYYDSVTSLEDKGSPRPMFLNNLVMPGFAGRPTCSQRNLIRGYLLVSWLLSISDSIGPDFDGSVMRSIGPDYIAQSIGPGL